GRGGQAGRTRGHRGAATRASHGHAGPGGQRVLRRARASRLTMRVGTGGRDDGVGMTDAAGVAPMKKSLVKNPLFARYFNRFAARREEQGNRELRQELLSGLSGRVIEVGAGNGLNFPHYPGAVREVVAVEPEPYLRDRAAEAAAAASVPIRVTDGTARDLPAADGEFDAVVVSGLLCSIPDAPAALAEFRRVLRPAGQLRFYEHVRSRDAIFARYQRAADLIWPRLMGGCHVERRTQSAIGGVFTLERCRGFRFPPSAAFSPVAPRIIGVARKAETRGGRLSGGRPAAR